MQKPERQFLRFLFLHFRLLKRYPIERTARAFKFQWKGVVMSLIRELYTQYYDELRHFLWGRTQDYAAAEDIAQETFLRAMGHEDTLRHMQPSQRRAWLYRTAKNLATDRFRRMKALPMPEEPISTQTDFTALEVESLCACLSDKDRTIFTLRYDYGYNASEIAAMVDLSPANVRMRLKIARALLKKELE